ncbi:hypothetical protein D9M68_641410 [compost metagenome]
MQVVAEFLQRKWLGKVLLHVLDGREYQAPALLQGAWSAWRVRDRAAQRAENDLQHLLQRGEGGAVGAAWIGQAPFLAREGAERAA